MEICLNCMREMSGGFCHHCKRPQPERQNPVYGLPLGHMLHNHYLIGTALGAGGFGITYAAYDLMNNRRTVIKECFPTALVERQPGTLIPQRRATVSEEACAKVQNGFLREANFLHQLGECSGIAQVYHLFSENGTAYYAMEFLDGMDIRNRVRQAGYMSWEELKPLTMEILHTLEFLHGKGIIHRDIAPDNLFLTENGIKLIDFGAARSTLTGQALTRIMKPGFAPVEQYTVSGQGPWTDVYALCATLYYSLTGTMPVASTNRTDQDRLVPPRQINPEIPVEVEKVILKGMALLPADRYQNVSELKAALTGKGHGKTERKSAPPEAEASFTMGSAAQMPGNGTEQPQQPQQPAETGVKGKEPVISQGQPIRQKQRFQLPVLFRPIWMKRSFGELEGLEGFYAGRRIPLVRKTVIGRDSTICQIVFPENAVGVSRVHCRIYYILGLYLIRDEGSSFGTWRGNIALLPGRWYLLQKGELIRLGSRELIRII